MSPKNPGPKCGCPEIFWGEIAPSEHFVQIYGDEQVFLDSLEGFVGGGLKAGEAVIVIATAEHRRGLDERLAQHGVDLDRVRTSEQYISLDAESTLAEFMIHGWPDDARFASTVGQIIDRARFGGRRVRAFGEMVALLWAQGRNGATVRLEYLWNEFMNTNSFSLFCAYPKSGFTDNSLHSLHQICRAHSRVVDN